MSHRTALARFPLLSLMGPAWLDAWLAEAEERPFRLGEDLCQAGTWGRWLYLLLEGRVRVLRQGEGGRDVVMGIFGPGDVFGEYALLPPGVMPATCRAAGSGRLLRLKLRRLRLALAEIPDFGSSIRPWLRLHALLRYLRDGACMGFMSAPSFLPLQNRFRTLRLPAEQSVQADGLFDDHWFYVRGGTIHLETGPDLLGPGDSFGEQALAGTPLPLATSASDVELFALSREAFLARLEGEGPIGQQSLIPAFQARPAPQPWIAQREEADCGVAALTMVAQAHGRGLHIEEVRRLTPVGRRGTNMEELRQAAEALGFRVRAVRIGLDQLADVRLPAISLMQGAHYVVVYATTEEGVTVGDPAVGVARRGRAVFQREWTGNLLVLTPPASQRSVMESGSWFPAVDGDANG